MLLLGLVGWMVGGVLFAPMLRAAVASSNCSARGFGVDLSGCDLRGVDLSGAILTRADLSNANLSGVNLAGANLTDAELESANLTGANLTRANLAGVRSSSADYSYAILTKTATPTKSRTPTKSKTRTATAAKGATLTRTKTRTRTAIKTQTRTKTRTRTATKTQTPTKTGTATRTSTATRTPTPSATVTASGATIFEFSAADSSDWMVSQNATSLGSDPGLTLTVGRLYRFSKLISAHPLSIRNADNSVYTGVAGFPLNGVQSVDFTLPVSAPSTLRYVCDAHASMSGVITVVP